MDVALLPIKTKDAATGEIRRWPAAPRGTPLAASLREFVGRVSVAFGLEAQALCLVWRDAAGDRILLVPQEASAEADWAEAHRATREAQARGGAKNRFLGARRGGLVQF